MIAPCCGTELSSPLRPVIDNNWQMKGRDANMVSYFGCPNCASLLIKPAPTPRELSDHFCVAYYRDVELENSIADDKAPRYRFVLEELSRLCPTPGDLLDVGCAHGYGLDVAREFGWSPCGIEIDDDIFNLVTQRGYRVAKGTSVSDWKSEKPLDAILYMDVLYYFDNPYQELLKAHEKLAAGGWLVVRVSLWARLVTFLRRISRLFPGTFFQRRASHYLCDHIIEFSEAGFERLLGATGFEIKVKTVDWGAGWRSGGSPLAGLARITSEFISGATGIRMTPSLHYIARKL